MASANARIIGADFELTATLLEGPTVDVLPVTGQGKVDCRHGVGVFAERHEDVGEVPTGSPSSP